MDLVSAIRVVRHNLARGEETAALEALTTECSLLIDEVKSRAHRASPLLNLPTEMVIIVLACTNASTLACVEQVSHFFHAQQGAEPSVVHQACAVLLKRDHASLLRLLPRPTFTVQGLCCLSRATSGAAKLSRPSQQIVDSIVCMTLRAKCDCGGAYRTKHEAVFCLYEAPEPYRVPLICASLLELARLHGPPVELAVARAFAAMTVDSGSYIKACTVPEAVYRSAPLLWTSSNDEVFRSMLKVYLELRKVQGRGDFDDIMMDSSLFASICVALRRAIDLDERDLAWDLLYGPISWVTTEEGMVLECKELLPLLTAQACRLLCKQEVDLDSGFVSGPLDLLCSWIKMSEVSAAQLSECAAIAATELTLYSELSAGGLDQSEHLGGEFAFRLLTCIAERQTSDGTGVAEIFEALRLNMDDFDAQFGPFGVPNNTYSIREDSDNTRAAGCVALLAIAESGDSGRRAVASIAGAVHLMLRCQATETEPYRCTDVDIPLLARELLNEVIPLIPLCDTDKKLRKAHKLLRDIQELHAKKEAGERLEANQLKKLEREPAVRAEIGLLEGA